MKFQIKKTSEINENSNICTLCFVFEDDILENKKSELFSYLDKLSNNELGKQIFEYKTIKCAHLDLFKYSISDKLMTFVCGLGKKENFTLKKLSQAAATAARAIKNLNFETLALELPTIDFNSEISKEDIARAIIPAIRIGLYEFKKYSNSKKITFKNIEILENNLTSELEKNIQIGAYISSAMKFAKDLVNEPAQNATPFAIAKIAKEIAQENNLEIEIFDKKQIKEKKMNAYLAVSQGSVHEPYFIHLTYKPEGVIRKKVALVGKGITFDAGGMNIKPATSMLTMKDDMTGAASVLSIIQAVSKMKLDIELHIISALCENMTSGSAYKQGDILTAMNGKTIEVDNTDAEGRITLADALCFADTLGVDEVIDIATLTGAVIVSLGNNITGVMGNNQEQIDKFIEISKKSCENTWQMPILEELKDNLKSEIADFKNTGGRNAGTSTAAWFLSNFTKSNKWLHLDIAGTAYLDKSNKETLQGPTGVMIRSLINYLIG